MNNIDFKVIIPKRNLEKIIANKNNKINKNNDSLNLEIGIHSKNKCKNTKNKSYFSSKDLMKLIDSKQYVIYESSDIFADVQVKIPFGKYYVQEIKAPDGYYLNDKKFDFELIWSQELQKENVLIVNIADSENPIINYEIVLPKTGVNSSILFSSIGIATIILTGASVLISKKNSLKED